MNAPVQPRVSALVWVALGLSVLAIALAAVGWVLSESASAAIAQSAVVLTYPAFPLAIVALGLAIAGTVRSARKRAGAWAIVLAAVILIAPLVFFLVILLLWVGAGTLSQLSGGPIVG